MITKINVGDNLIVKYNTPKVCQILEIWQVRNDNNAISAKVELQSITVEQAATNHYHVDVLILCSAQTGTKLNRKRTYNASLCECLVEYLDEKRALITKLEKLIT